ncbi:MAG: tetratricopeptide repeat protein [Candidatus Rifleibacteriota bacterium]
MSSANEISPKKKLLLFFFLVFAAPVILLSGLETSLRLLVPGEPTSFFVEDQLADGKKVMRANFLAAKRFFPGNLARKPLPDFFPSEKAPETFRVFVLGESAARGEFLADFSFARMLQAALTKQYPGRKIEVINTGIPAINSWVITEIAAEIVNYQPDLVIVYAGHNEFIGPYGPGSIFSGQTNRFMAKLGIFASSLRMIQLLKSIGSSSESISGWRGLDMFSHINIDPGSPAVQQAEENWRLNLKETLQIFKKNSIKTIVCSVPVNALDCAPFSSKSAGEDFEKIIEIMCDLYNEKEWEQIEQTFTANAGKFSEHAMANWLTAHAKLNLGKKAEAHEKFVNALNLDCFKVRALPTFNLVAQKAAEEANAAFIDLSTIFAEADPHGITGSDLVYDHVHLTENGHYLAAAKIFAETVKIIGQTASSAVFPEFEEICRLTGFTDNDRIFHLSQAMAAAGVSPLSRQFSNLQTRKQLNDKLLAIQENFNMADSIVQTTEALESAPENARLAARLAQMFILTGNPDEAKAYFNRSLEKNPFDIDTINNLGTVFQNSGQYEKAIELFVRAVKLAPNFAEAHFNLGLSAVRTGKPDAAIGHYKDALAIEPSYPAAMHNLANVFFERKKFTDAEFYYRMASLAAPGDISPLIGAGNACLAQGNLELARKTYQQAVIAFPQQPEGYFSLGLLHEKHSSKEEAFGNYLEALTRFKHRPSADKIFSLIAAQAVATSTESLNKIALQCCEASEYTDPWHLQLLGVTYAATGKTEEARSILLKALEIAQKSKETALARDLEDSLRTLERK